MTNADTSRVAALEDLRDRRSHSENNELQELYLKRWLRVHWLTAQEKIAQAAKAAAAIPWKFRSK